MQQDISTPHPAPTLNKLQLYLESFSASCCRLLCREKSLLLSSDILSVLKCNGIDETRSQLCAVAASSVLASREDRYSLSTPEKRLNTEFTPTKIKIGTQHNSNVFRSKRTEYHRHVHCCQLLASWVVRQSHHKIPLFFWLFLVI
jgi:hypothetical protein